MYSLSQLRRQVDALKRKYAVELAAHKLLPLANDTANSAKSSSPKTSPRSTLNVSSRSSRSCPARTSCAACSPRPKTAA